MVRGVFVLLAVPHSSMGQNADGVKHILAFVDTDPCTQSHHGARRPTLNRSKVRFKSRFQLVLKLVC